MSIYATFFSLFEDDDHERDCARNVPITERPEGGGWSEWWEDGGLTRYEGDNPCTCSALRGPYDYLGSNRSITGFDHRRSGSLHLCRAVGTWTLRLSVHAPDPKGEWQDATVLLDRRQVEAVRDALTEFLDYWSDPDDYHRADAHDAANPTTPEQLTERKRREAETAGFIAGIKAARAMSRDPPLSPPVAGSRPPDAR